MFNLVVDCSCLDGEQLKHLRNTIKRKIENWHKNFSSTNEPLNISQLHKKTKIQTVKH
jgi:hypothetical protein